MIYIANHDKWTDEFVILRVLQKLGVPTLRVMMADSLAKTPLGWLLFVLGAFPARSGRGLDRSLELPMRYLAEGHNVMIYPQGRPQNGVRQTRPGARELSLRTGVPIIPIFVKAVSLNFWRIFIQRHDITVRVGEPFHPEPDEDVMEKVWELHE